MLTTNAHDVIEAEARALPSVPSDSLKFICEEGEVTLFVPPSVAKATADAFNKAMQEHLAAASRDKAGGGAGSSQVAPSPSSDVLTGTDWSA